MLSVSCFNEKLAEDRKVNRLEDSYLLWRSVQSCKLLARTQMVSATIFLSDRTSGGMITNTVHRFSS